MNYKRVCECECSSEWLNKCSDYFWFYQVFPGYFQLQWTPTDCYDIRSLVISWRNHCWGTKTTTNNDHKWKCYKVLWPECFRVLVIYMRSGLKWCTRAQKASPFFQDEVMLVTLTPLYPAVTCRHLCKFMTLKLNFIPL